MSKRILLRFTTCICFMLSLTLLGHTNVFADEVKPVHEYNFNNDDVGSVYDLGQKALTGYKPSKVEYIPSFNEMGMAARFSGSNYVRFPAEVLPKGAKSIRFNFRKDASTVSTDKPEAVLSNINRFGEGLYIGIGVFKENFKPGILYIINQNKDSSVNFEIRTPNSICDGQWHDILFTWDGTTNPNSIKLYVDNMTTPTEQTTPNSTENYQNVAFYAALCDYQPSKYTPRTFIGDLDNLKLYDLAVSPKSDTTSNLKAVGGDSKVDLTWNEVTDATSYIVKRSTTAGGPYTTIASGITGTTYTDTGVTNGTTYYYVVTAIINGSEGWNSNEASATPQASTDQPTGNKALLVITMVTGERKEYEMTADKINDFVTWYNSKATSSPTYAIEKDYNKASFTARKDYIAYEQISNFEVNEYNN